MPSVRRPSFLDLFDLKSILDRSGPISVIALCMLLIFIIAMVLRDDVVRALALSVVLFIILIASIVEIYVYLQTSRRKFPRIFDGTDDGAPSKVALLETEVRALREIVEKTPLPLAHDIFTKEDKEKIQKDLLSKLGERTVLDLAKKLLETRAKLATMDAHIESARTTAKHMLDRLESEVDDLQRRATINLLIGIGISAVGVGVLILFVFSLRPEDVKDLPDRVLGYYVASRLSLVIFIEVFAYFFLRLYRYGIFEIKYFQNEITNAEFRLIALEAAFRSEDTDAIKKACIEMSKVERNFILKKGETTLSLKRDEIEQEHDKSIISILERVLPARPMDKAQHTTSGHG